MSPVDPSRARLLLRRLRRQAARTRRPLALAAALGIVLAAALGASALERSGPDTVLLDQGLVTLSAAGVVVERISSQPLAPDEVDPEPEVIDPASLPGRPIPGGKASFYGEEFAGSRTASGERFDPNALTAAHPSLPMGSKVRVTNLRNGRSVVVRINDRGPFHGDRVIDVSRRAAQELGFHRRGVTQVRLEVLPRRTPA